MTLTGSGPASPYREGLIVRNPGAPDWGPGRVLAVDGTKLTVYFRDLPGDHPMDAVKKIETKQFELRIAAEQADLLLDNLPPFKDGKFTTGELRVTLESGIELFHSHNPLYFDDPNYLTRKAPWPPPRSHVACFR